MPPPPPPSALSRRRRRPTPTTPSTWPRRGNWQLGLGPALGALLSLPLSLFLSWSRFGQFIHSIYATPPHQIRGIPARMYATYTIHIHSYIYSMPAIYIQLAGELTHFTPPAAPSAVSLKLTRAFQVRLQLATGNWQWLLCHCCTCSVPQLRPRVF